MVSKLALKLVIIKQVGVAKLVIEPISKDVIDKINSFSIASSSVDPYILKESRETKQVWRKFMIDMKIDDNNTKYKNT